MRAIGIDYSLTSPAVCIHPLQKEWSVENCRMFFLTSRPKMEIRYNQTCHIEGQCFEKYENDIMRFMQNARAIKRFCNPETGDHIGIEGYAFGARGSRIFQIGEATGFLVLFMMMNSAGSSFINSGRVPLRPAPSEIKKFATGKGNANKQAMYDAWLSETKVDLLKILGLKKNGSPADDLVDAYWICKYIYMSRKL